MQDANILTRGGATAIGIAGIKRNMELGQKKDKKEMNDAFSDLASLKQKSQNMVKIAKQIK